MGIIFFIIIIYLIYKIGLGGIITGLLKITYNILQMILHPISDFINSTANSVSEKNNKR